MVVSEGHGLARISGFTGEWSFERALLVISPATF